MRRAAGLLFDKDGTLFDFQKSWARFTLRLIDRLAEGDGMVSARLGVALGIALDTGHFLPDSPIIAGTPDAAVIAALPHLPGWTAASLTDLINTEAAQVPQVEAVPLQRLFTALASAGHPLGIATNDAENSAKAHLQAAGIEEYFEFIAGYDSGFGAKPEPGQCNAFTKAVALPPESCVMVGDSLHDLIAGRAAGMRCVAVLTGVADAKTLAPHADAVFPDIGHLPAWLAQI